MDIHHFFTAEPAGQALGRVLWVVVVILTLVPGLIWYERRLLSWMQDRIGPNRVGPKGLLQPIADGVKLFFKEDITPTLVDRAIYFIAPAIALFPAFALGGTLPWGPDLNWTPISNANIGILFALAVSSLGVYGVVLAGYGSDNKYSLMGGLRASAQLISYELAMGMSLAAIALISGSLRMTDMVADQTKPLFGVVPFISNWNIFTPWGLISAAIFLVCMVAETNRAPFDLPEAENELIAGYHTEYSSMKFAVFFMGEYAAMFVFSGIFAAVFLGGYDPLIHIPTANVGWLWPLIFAPAVFLTKCFLGISLYIWLRGSLPRLRYDQLMSLGWRSLLPLAVANFVLAAFWMLAKEVAGPYAGFGAWAIAAAVLGGLYAALSRLFNPKNVLADREVIFVNEAAPRTIELVETGVGQG